MFWTVIMCSQKIRSAIVGVFDTMLQIVFRRKPVITIHTEFPWGGEYVCDIGWLSCTQSSRLGVFWSVCHGSICIFCTPAGNRTQN